MHLGRRQNPSVSACVASCHPKLHSDGIFSLPSVSSSKIQGLILSCPRCLHLVNKSQAGTDMSWAGEAAGSRA